MRRFPFGRPVRPCAPSASEPRSIFVLGAYPSAIHVRWCPPKPWSPISAIAVDNEPTPFWTGSDEAERIEAWKRAVRWNDSWGTVAPVGRLNGSSGAWVEDKVLAPLRAGRSASWITDSVDTYRASVGAAERLADTYRPFSAEAGLPLDDILPHPSETDIVNEALRCHRERLALELTTARPELVVTLGNAALRVLVGIVSVAGVARRKLQADGYGRERRVEVAGRSIAWLPLAHPAAPATYQRAHEQWSISRRRGV